MNELYQLAIFIACFVYVLKTIKEEIEKIGHESKAAQYYKSYNESMQTFLKKMDEENLMTKLVTNRLEVLEKRLEVIK